MARGEVGEKAPGIGVGGRKGKEMGGENQTGRGMQERGDDLLIIQER